MDLIQEVAELTGLPQDIVTNELYKIADAKGFDKENIKMDELRLILSDFMQDVLVNLKEDLSLNASQA